MRHGDPILVRGFFAMLLLQCQIGFKRVPGFEDADRSVGRCQSRTSRCSQDSRFHATCWTSRILSLSMSAGCFQIVETTYCMGLTFQLCCTNLKATWCFTTRRHAGPFWPEFAAGQRFMLHMETRIDGANTEFHHHLLHFWQVAPSGTCLHVLGEAGRRFIMLRQDIHHAAGGSL